MSAPRHVVDALECVLSIFFSNTRHNLRAAFLLCDELVEVAMREKLKQAGINPKGLSFPALLSHTSINLTPGGNPLGTALEGSHKSRNDMQHNNPAATVDQQHCADAISDAMDLLEHCFVGTKAALPDRFKVALRVVRVISRQGNPSHYNEFVRLMTSHTWRGNRERAKVNEAIVQPGERNYWGLVIMPEFAEVEGLLNSAGVPPF